MPSKKLYLYRIRYNEAPDSYVWVTTAVFKAYAKELARNIVDGERVEVYEENLRGVCAFSKVEGVLRESNMKHCRLHAKAAPAKPSAG